MVSPLRIAVNARSLDSSASPLVRLTAAHLMSLLEADDSLQTTLVPGETPPPIPAGASVHPLSSGPRGGLSAAIFDQFRFPRAARRLRADLLLCLHPAGPIAAPAPCAVWYGDGEDPGMAGAPGGRIYRSLSAAGLRGAAAVLLPNDLPAAPARLSWAPIAPIVPQALFAGETGPDVDRFGLLPEAFVLAAAETAATLPLLLAAWTWVDRSLGDTFSLLLVAEDDTTRGAAERAIEGMELSRTVRAVRLVDGAWPEAFRRAAALLHAGERHNAAALRWALAAKLPVAAVGTAVSESIVGPAGYLVAPEARALGAACLALLVDEALANSLRERGVERARSYRANAQASGLSEALRRASRGGATTPARRSRSTPPR